MSRDVAQCYFADFQLDFAGWVIDVQSDKNYIFKSHKETLLVKQSELLLKQFSIFTLSNSLIGECGLTRE